MKPIAFIVAAAACCFAGTASAETRSFTGCPASGQTDITAGPRLSISWVIAGEPRNIAFLRTGIELGGGIGELSAAEAAVYEPVLADLRAAAAAQRQVTVYYESETRSVRAIRANWNLPC